MERKRGSKEREKTQENLGSLVLHIYVHHYELSQSLHCTLINLIVFIIQMSLFIRKLW